MTSSTPGGEGRRVRIMVVDDHPVVRDGLAEVINAEADLTVCAMADARHEAIQAAERTKPDLVIVDLLLKNSSGMELIKDIHSRWPQILILVVSMQDENLYAERALRAGARGYIAKHEATRGMLAAIRQVLGGGIYLSQATASSVLSRLATHPQAVGDSVAERLSDRELQIFELTGTGLNTRQIADRLCLDVKTVETYRARIKEKLELKGASDLLQLAIRWNADRWQG